MKYLAGDALAAAIIGFLVRKTMAGRCDSHGTSSDVQVGFQKALDTETDVFGTFLFKCIHVTEWTFTYIYCVYEYAYRYMIMRPPQDSNQ
jgi:hypothetical protein